MAWSRRCGVCRDDDSSDLCDSSRSGGGRRERLRSALVIAEVTGSVVLLVSCGLLIRALWRIQAVDPGFRPEDALTLRTSLPMPKYARRAPREAFYKHVLSEASRLPGVTGAAYTSYLPMTLSGVWPVEVEGHPQDLPSRQNASLRFVTHGLALAALGVVVSAALAYGAGLELQALLAGIHPADMTVFASTVALCLIMAVMGCLFQRFARFAWIPRRLSERSRAVVSRRDGRSARRDRLR